MNVITRLRQLIAPPCGHQDTIADLEQSIADARNRAQGDLLHREIAERERAEFAVKLELALAKNREQTDLIESLSAAGAKLTADLADERARVKALKVELQDLTTTFAESCDALEQANAQIVVLEQQLRDAGADEQLALIHAPASEPAAPVSTKPELVSDTTPEGVFRVIGLFFIDRRYWLLSRDEGKTKVAAAVRDKAFLDRLHKHDVLFGDGDSLRVKLNTQTWRRPDGSLFTQYAITEVLEVLPFNPPEQIPLGAQELSHA